MDRASPAGPLPSVAAHTLALYRARAPLSPGASLPFRDALTGAPAFSWARPSPQAPASRRRLDFVEVGLEECSDEDGVMGVLALQGKRALLRAESQTHYQQQREVVGDVVTAALAASVPSITPALALELAQGPGASDGGHCFRAHPGQHLGRSCPAPAPQPPLTSWQRAFSVFTGVGNATVPEGSFTPPVPIGTVPVGTGLHLEGTLAAYPFPSAMPEVTLGMESAYSAATPPLASIPLAQEEREAAGLWRVCPAYLAQQKGRPASFAFAASHSPTAAAAARVHRPTLLSRSQYHLNLPIAHKGQYTAHPALARLRRARHARARVTVEVLRSAALWGAERMGGVGGLVVGMEAAARASGAAVLTRDIPLSGTGTPLAPNETSLRSDDPLTHPLRRARLAPTVTAGATERVFEEFFGPSRVFGSAAAGMADGEIEWVIRLVAPRSLSSTPPPTGDVKLPFPTLPLPGAANLAFNVEASLLCPGASAADTRAEGTALDPPADVRVLPAEVSDGHFALLPGEPHMVVVRARAADVAAATAAARARGASCGRGKAAPPSDCGTLWVQGWNMEEMFVPLPCPAPV